MSDSFTKKEVSFAAEAEQKASGLAQNEADPAADTPPPPPPPPPPPKKKKKVGWGI